MHHLLMYSTILYHQAFRSTMPSCGNFGYDHTHLYSTWRYVSMNLHRHSNIDNNRQCATSQCKICSRDLCTYTHCICVTLPKETLMLTTIHVVKQHVLHLYRLQSCTYGCKRELLSITLIYLMQFICNLYMNICVCVRTYIVPVHTLAWCWEMTFTAVMVMDAVIVCTCWTFGWTGARFCAPVSFGS